MPFLSKLLQTNAFVLFFCASVIIFQFFKAGYTYPIADALGYLEIANDLTQYGIFTNGYFSETHGVTITPGAFFAPAYPAFVSFITQFDSLSQEAVVCLSDRETNCNIKDLSTLYYIQILLAAISVFVIFQTVQLLFKNTVMSWLTILIVLATGVHAYYARHILTENLAFFFFYLFGYMLVISLSSQNKWLWALTGLSLASAIYARPTYYYLIFFTPLVVLGWYYFQQGAQKSIKTILLSVSIFIIFTYIPLIPWMYRNYLLIGEFAISHGYASFILVQRLAYNLMSWAEWGVSFIYWLPDFGDSLAAKLFTPELYEKLSWQKNSYYIYGNTEFRADTLQAAGSTDNHFSYLLNNYLLGDLVKHILVSIPLALRGIWIGKYLGLVGFIALPVLILWLKKKKQLSLFLTYMSLSVFILGINAFVSVNIARYNIPAVVIFASSTALILILASQKFSPRLLNKIQGYIRVK